MIDYRCSACGVEGVKLWRQGGVFFEKVRPVCADCAVQEERAQGHLGPEFAPWDIDTRGAHMSARGETFTIGHLVPAVPTKDHMGYWGYLSIEPGCFKWWKRLPTLQAF